MGYYTYFSITLYGEDEAYDKAAKEICELGEHAENSLLGGSLEKWYSHREDLSKVAKNNPEVLIRVCGDGEESDDLWEERYKGELFEFHSASIPPFTTKELQIPKTNN